MSLPCVLSCLHSHPHPPTPKHPPTTHTRVTHLRVRSTYLPTVLPVWPIWEHGMSIHQSICRVHIEAQKGGVYLSLSKQATQHDITRDRLASTMIKIIINKNISTYIHMHSIICTYKNLLGTTRHGPHRLQCLWWLRIGVCSACVQTCVHVANNTASEWVHVVAFTVARLDVTQLLHDGSQHDAGVGVMPLAESNHTMRAAGSACACMSLSQGVWDESAGLISYHCAFKCSIRALIHSSLSPKFNPSLSVSAWVQRLDSHYLTRIVATKYLNAQIPKWWTHRLPVPR